MPKQFLRTILVIGDNPDEIIKKYDANNITGKHLFLKRSNAAEHKKNRLLLMKGSLNNFNLNDLQKEMLHNEIEDIEDMSEIEYFMSVTEGCTYDENTGDAYKEFNPNAFYKSVRSPQKIFEEKGEESGFCNPFKLKEDYISYSAEKGEIDWSKNHLYNKHVYEIAWDLIVNGKKPRTEAEKTIQENMKNRRGYFNNFKDKDDYVSYSTSFWTYGVATKDKYEDIDELGLNGNDWIKNFYDKYIKNLSDDTLLTLYEVQIKD